MILELFRGWFFFNWAVFFLVVWGVYTGRTCLRHAYAVGFYQGFGLRGV